MEQENPTVTEDGICIDPESLDKFSFKTYESRVIEVGTNAYPLNLYQ